MTPISRSQIRDRLENLNTWKRGASRAPHKPLLLLLAFSRIVHDQPRMASFAELESPLRGLLDKYGPPRRSHNPEYPFWWLQTDGLWETSYSGPLIRRKGHTDPRKSELIDKNVLGGLPEDMFKLLNLDRRFLGEVTEALAAAHFPASVSEELLAELGIAKIELS